MRVIIGLGNPGDKYKNTRHNAGFLGVDEIAKKHDCQWAYNKKFKSEICQLPDGTLLVKPQTFMNNSGVAVAAVLNYYHLLPKRLGFLSVHDAPLADVLTVIHDDLDIELGKYKISLDSRSAGHRGVQDIIDHIKTKNFKRVRIGIRSQALDKIPADKFVLMKFSADELKIINAVIKEIVNESA
ncbi:MAG: aminoacyl-tRNA hydrolase [Patescibacteria group bacterium]|jgi:PTH1 family peptidyl-tRNA hydrolase